MYRLGSHIGNVPSLCLLHPFAISSNLPSPNLILPYLLNYDQNKNLLVWEGGTFWSKFQFPSSNCLSIKSISKVSLADPCKFRFCIKQFLFMFDLNCIKKYSILSCVRAGVQDRLKANYRIKVFICRNMCGYVYAVQNYIICS